MSHRITPYHHTPTSPRRYYDPDDEWLLHQERDDFVLAWSAEIHRLANRYRATRQQCLESIDLIEQQVEFEITDARREHRERIRQHLVGGMLNSLRIEIGSFDFAAANQRLRSIRHALNGQFISAGLEEYRIRRVSETIAQLRQAVSSRNVGNVRDLKRDERALLGSFLQQEPERL